MQSTIFKNMYSQDCRSIEWQEIINIITGNTLAGDTAKYRYYLSCKLDDDAQKLKKRMPAFTPAVVCNGGRKPENFVSLTGVVCATLTMWTMSRKPWLLSRTTFTR